MVDVALRYRRWIIVKASENIDTRGRGERYVIDQGQQLIDGVGLIRIDVEHAGTLDLAAG
jgi:hypothetical protein